MSVKKDNFSINDCISKHKNDILSVIIYCAGLIIGVLIYSGTADKFKDLFSSSFLIQSVVFKDYFTHCLFIYISIYLLVVLFSYSFIGNFALYFAPLLIGIELAIKISFYYTTYSLKGIGYSLLIIIPEASIFITAILFGVNKGVNLSESVLKAYKKLGTNIDVNLKSYLISFIKYFISIIVICLINSGLYCVLSSIITL